MASGSLKAALLIVSTTAAKDASADASGPILTQVLKDEGDGKWEVHDTKIVTDDVLAIQRQITAWTDGPDSVNLVVTTGGTGFATGDYTPEVRLSYQSYKSLCLCYSGSCPSVTQASTRSCTWHVSGITRNYTL